MPNRPTRDEWLMQIAEVVALRSTCSRANVGVVVAKDGRILGTGYNGAPKGMEHCTHTDYEVKDGLSDVVVRYQDPSGPCLVAVHAEANAIAWSARWGICLDGAELYTTLSPCLPCAQLIVNAGIIRVVAKEPYRDEAGAKLLVLAGLMS